MRRTFDRKEAAKWGAVVLALLFLNWNSGTQRYNDQIDNCEYSRVQRDIPAANGWRTAELRARSQGQPEFAETYHRSHVGLDRLIARSCRDRYDRPGPFG